MSKVWQWIKDNWKLTLVVVIILALLTWILILNITLKQQQSQLQNDLITLKNLGDGIIRSQTNVVSSEDLDKFAKQQNVNWDIIKKDLKDIKAEVSAINVIVTTTPGYEGHDLPSDRSRPGDHPTIPGSIPCGPDGTCANPDKFGYLNNEQVLELKEPFDKNLSVPLGNVRFKAWEQNPWNLTLNSRKYKVTTTIAEKEDGTKVAYNQFEIETDGKSYKLPIEEAKLVQQELEAKLRFDPRLYLGLAGGVNFNSPKGVIPELIPHLSVFLGHYGKSKSRPQWALGGIGIGFQAQQLTPALIVTPITYNLGSLGPENGFVRNIHIAPSVAVDINGSVTIAGSIQVGL